MAQIDKTMPSFSMHLQDVLPVYGRTVVVHLASNSAVKPACGVIGGAFGVTGASVHTDIMPGYTGGSNVRAAAWVGYVDGTLTVNAVLSGLGSEMTGGWHIHSGFSCDDAGGHYFEGLNDDPWCSTCTTWTSNKAGVAYVTWSSPDFADGRASGVGAHVRGALGGRRQGCMRRDRAVDGGNDLAR